MSTFKNKFRTLALSAALLAGVGMTNTSQAVVLNNIDNLGDAGLFQYYTVNNEWQTFFRIINTSDQAVSIKLRFREAANSRDVLDFIVFLSPYDMWVGWTDPNALNIPGGGPGIRSDDTSCLFEAPNPNLSAPGFHPVENKPGRIGAEFQNAAFTNEYADGASNAGNRRLKEGHMEVIGIAQHGAIGAFTAAVSHDGDPWKPSNCGYARTLFSTLVDQNGNVINPSDAEDLDDVLGFNGYLVNLAKGQGGGFDPDVLAHFARSSLVPEANSTDVEVNLDSGGNAFFGTPFTRQAFLERKKQQGVLMNNNGVLVPPQDVSGSVDAVSAWFMRDKVINEWMAVRGNDAPGATFESKFTQWILTFPTKNYYVDLQNDNVDFLDDISQTLARSYLNDNNLLVEKVDAYAPFTEAFPVVNVAGGTALNGKSCEPFTMRIWDREERLRTFVSPSPDPRSKLCNETNVLNFDPNYDPDFNTEGLGSNFGVDVPALSLPDGHVGWAELTWSGVPAVNQGLDITGPFGQNAIVTLYGLPVTGFMFTVYNSAEDNSLNYASIHEHKYTRRFGFACIDGNTCDQPTATNMMELGVEMQ